MTRAENVRRAQQLRAEGFLIREIAEIMNVARSTAGQYLSDPDGSRMVARKDSYRGVCEDCGAPTDGSNGAAAAPRHCLYCNGKLTAKANKEAWLPFRRMVEEMWAEGMTIREIGEALGWSPTRRTNISVMRSRGYNLPHRYSEERIARMTANCHEHMAKARAAQKVAA